MTIDKYGGYTLEQGNKVCRYIYKRIADYYRDNLCTSNKDISKHAQPINYKSSDRSEHLA